MNQPLPHFHVRRRAFSLIEVLLAVFILAIGLIMVASVFPVGADWTRQATEDTVSQSIALNAFSVIKDNYATNSLNTATAGKFSGIATSANPTFLQPIPFFTSIPISERTYQYGNANPFPSQNPLACNYYWTALARLSPGQATPASKTYDLYIFVFRKGDLNQEFRTNAVPPVATDPTLYIPLQNSATSDNYQELTSAPNFLRDKDDLSFATSFPNYHWYFEPTLVAGKYNPGTYDTAKNIFISPPFPPLGYIAVGSTSGTVFRQGLDATTTPPGAISRPPASSTELNGTDKVIFAPPADGTLTSPLIYVYQTTVSF